MLAIFAEVHSKRLFQNSGKEKSRMLCSRPPHWKYEIRHFHVSRAVTVKKCIFTRKREARTCKVVVLQILNLACSRLSGSGEKARNTYIQLYIRVRAFSIQWTRLFRSLEQANLDLYCSVFSVLVDIVVPSSSDRRRRRSLCSLASWGPFGMHTVLTYIDLARGKSEALGNI